jgi:multiple sugar transport system permease protein
MYRQEQRVGWLLILPSAVLLMVFLVGPSIMALAFSFTNQRLVAGRIPTRFIGLENYARIIGDESFRQALWNNVRFTAFVVPLQCGFALLLALLVNQKIRLVGVFRTIYFSPIAITMVVVAIIWTLLFHRTGTVNTILNSITFGWFGNPDWLLRENLAMAAIIIVSIWQSVAFQMIIFLAGLQEIPVELYEAARIAGASTWQSFRHVTLPGLRNTTVFVLVTTTILAFRLYTQVEVMTQGGPQGTTNTVVRYMIQTGFRGMRIGYASAITFLFLAFVLAISLLQRVIVRSERM